MKTIRHISIIAPSNSSCMSITGPMDIFYKAIQFYKQLNPNKKFDDPEVKIISTNSIEVLTANNVVLKCHSTIKETSTTDLIILPSVEGVFEQLIDENSDLISWLIMQYNRGACIGSFCNGTFLLAATGLLKNKEATTHWYSADKFRSMFPDVKLKETNIITDSGRLFTSGGATSFINFCIYLIEKFFDKNTALLTSKILLIDPHKIPQSAYSVFSTQKFHSDDNVLKSQVYIETNFKRNITIEEIQKVVSLSKRSFMRRFKVATNNTPIEYLQRVRIEAAKSILERKSKTIQEIAFECGYSDSSTFSKVFKKMVGISPSQYKETFNIPNFHSNNKKK